MVFTIFCKSFLLIMTMWFFMLTNALYVALTFYLFCLFFRLSFIFCLLIPLCLFSTFLCIVVVLFLHFCLL